MVEPTSEEFDRERRLLELEELRLRLRDLRAPWWRRLSVTAPLATIAAATLGLLWGIATGFFSVSLRELEVAKRELKSEIVELKARRDQQSVAHQNEKAGLVAEIEALRKRQRNALRDLNALSSPFLVSVFPERLHGHSEGKPPALSVVVNTVNLPGPGTMSIILLARCSARKQIYLGKLFVRQFSYIHNSRTIRFESDDLVAVTSRLPPNIEPHGCGYYLETVLTREDGKRTNAVMTDVTDVLEALQVIGRGHKR
jgi:hypothetical protein